MLPQSKGKMFLADERGLNEMAWFRTYNTFNFGRYYNEHKTPFGSLYVLNEDILAGGKGFNMLVEEPTDIILLPVVGAISFKNTEGHNGIIEAGQVQLLHMQKGTQLEIRNPYESDLVKFLQLWIKMPAIEETTPVSASFTLDNHLREIFNREGCHRGAIVKLASKEEAVYKLSNPENGVFVFAIEGDMEAQYRLLYAGDGLALWEVEEVEIEALSASAIVLIVEVSL
ncbi:pirin family protein [Chitinophaga tropicalis]|uniref:Pirin n=1 Tax=Chitinophaga tropicalis TaxID=2683588 RepID=A0A7K1U5C8_9BACT|nr:pirin family protein [Chitinophaga tropicalis]MVT09572.1 pirin [Chitinophaga tropicalis]